MGSALRSRPTLVIMGVHVWPGDWFGWRWHLRTGYDFGDGRGPIPDPGRPEAYGWAMTQARVLRRARRLAGRRLAERLDLPAIDGAP
jgi:hypothetical protein